MRRPEFIARQASCPTGLLGRVLAWIMAAETAAVNEQALVLLACRPDDHVLEVGFGHGRTLARAATVVPTGFVAGVDVSEQMVRMARDRNRQFIKEGRVEVQLADSARIPYPDGCFDRVYAMHILYFWHDPRVHLQEIYRVMKAGARFVLGFSPKEDERAGANFPAAIYRFYTSDEVYRLLAASGFTDIQMVRDRVASRDIIFGVGHRGVQ
ncbi:MAG: class I SAM-dependent methyltransferase [Deltaproteobacteria bacterium]|nr:class I SAM-dependent methyltransferase [Deltaproteobacteria bacterium]